MENDFSIPCVDCGATGYKYELDILNARKNKVVCPTCKGLKHIYNSPQDGSIFMIQHCQVGYWQELLKGKIVATLHIHICPIRDKLSGRPLFKKHEQNPLIAIPRIFIQIINMSTKAKHRKNGIMTKLLDKALADPKIEFATSSWDDSTADGRNFLLGRGFVQESNELVWRRSQENESKD